MCSGNRRGDRGDRTEQHQRIVFRGNEAPPLPELGGFGVDRVDHKGAASNESCCGHASLQGMLHQTGAYTAASPSNISCKLAEQQAGDRVRRLAGADRPRQHARYDSGWREAVVANDSALLVNYQDGGEAFFLIGERSGLEPMVQRGLPAAELGNVMRRGQRFWS